MRRKRIHGRKRSPFRNDPNLKDYSKNTYVPKFNKEDQGVIKPTPSNFEKFKSFRQRNVNLLQDLTMPGVSKTKGLIQATKDKLKKK